MIHISNLSDRHHLFHDPELYREVVSYLLYCHHESMEDDEICFRHGRRVPVRVLSGYDG